MKILQAWSKYIDGHGQYQDHWQIIGLGDDNKVYMWHDSTGTWELHFTGKPKESEAGTPDDPINLDDIPF